MCLPNDIIHEIIYHLQEDFSALISCSVVCRGFYLASRKHIFSSAYLHHESDVRTLQFLLIQNPELAPLFHTLHITLARPRVLSRIPRVLPLLTRVRHLVLGARGEPVVLNRGDIITAIPPLLHLPLLERLELRWISKFPAAYLYIPLKIKSLEMELVDVATISARGNCISVIAAPPPMALEAIHIDMMEQLKEWPLLHTPKLRRISMQRPGRGTQHIINASAQSLEDVIWNNYDPRYCDIDLGVVRNLRRLSFVISRPFAARVANAWTPVEELWLSISNILDAGCVARSLEELNIAIKSYTGGISSIHDDMLVGIGSLWSTLADGSRFPRLRRVVIHMDSEGCSPSIIKDTFHATIAERLPLLEEAGLLRTMLCKSFHWHNLL